MPTSTRINGIYCLLGAVALPTASDSIIKWLSPHYALHEIMLFRAIVSLSIAMIIVKLEGGLRYCALVASVCTCFAVYREARAD